MVSIKLHINWVVGVLRIDSMFNLFYVQHKVIWDLSMCSCSIFLIWIQSSCTFWLPVMFLFRPLSKNDS